MAQYKEKYKQVVINSIKHPSYYLFGDVVVLNLNACFVKRNNFIKFLLIVKEALELSNKVNLCNLASLCYKLNIPYESEDCIEFVRDIVNKLKGEYPDIQFVQNGINNCGEIDLQPFYNLIRLDTQHNYIFINYVLLECLKTLGYVNCQIWEILELTKDFNHIIPWDLLRTLPISTPNTQQQYQKILEILGCSQVMSPMMN